MAGYRERSHGVSASQLGWALTRERAAQFSFLLSIPAIVGAFALTADRESLAVGLAKPAPHVLGAALTALVGILALKIALGLLRAARFYHLAWYCWTLRGFVLLALVGS